MKYLKHTCLLIILFTCCIANAQNMQEGFAYLENGEFAQAKVFFSAILKEYPNNKTANLCYARALGLHDNPEKANELFSVMLEDYPNDFEIELNYAESLLWNKRYKDAKEYYTTLVTEHPESFPALLGYANTLSNLKEYPEALNYVNRALTASPNNPNALVSRKYIRLGYASQLMQGRNYNGALSILDDNLIDFPKDKDTLLNKANIYLMLKKGEMAKAAYREMAITTADSIVAYNGFALAEHTNGKDKKALKYAIEAVALAKEHKDTTLIKKANERYIQALIWNREYKMADEAIATETQKYPNDNSVLALSATLGMYRSDFKKSITDYEYILVNDSLSFDGNLGIANAYFADGKPNKAYKAVDKTLNIFENQKDAINFLGKLNTIYSPNVEEQLGYSYDNGDNKAYFSTTTLNIPLSTKWSVGAYYRYRKTENTVTDREAEANDFKAMASYQFHPKVSFNAALGATAVTSFKNDYNQLLAEAFFKAKPFKLQDLEVGYKRDVQNFNADLTDSEITADNFYINYNISSNFKLGWFTQYFFTTQSDGNQRNLLFTSLYYSFLSKPVLKGGINYQYISFTDRRPEVYFSPQRFNLGEVFVDFIKSEEAIENKGMYYGLNAAAGYQFIEQDKKQGTYRLQGKLGYKFSSRLVANIYGLHSNIASATAAGFTYTELGFRLKWTITKRPLFRTKKNK
ncbi:tetratricopeptide repeat protein [Flavobacterium litorale]|uniref:Tetratricopeptide repeat protein n=1 Tax=Flavobacterium litorale TaxID=2856519 RepID=A0ABX8V4Y4_9FLAO|nr:tetratricopeptide repeat protein [Flavobacterium litorale]QYJ67562.1 tetratricopeptide repeat protein [Flavobacterium litorale]